MSIIILALYLDIYVVLKLIIIIPEGKIIIHNTKGTTKTFFYQKRKYGWGWKGPLEVILPSLPAQVEPPKASLGPCHTVFNISSDGDSAASLGNLCPGHLPVKKSVSWCSGSLKLFCLCLCQLPLVLSVGITGKKLALSSCSLPSDISMPWYVLHFSILLYRLKSPSSLGRSHSRGALSPLWAYAGLMPAFFKKLKF